MELHSANEFSELMTRAGLGMKEAATLLGISPRTVRRHVRGETRRIPTVLSRFPRAACIRGIAEGLDPGVAEAFLLSGLVGKEFQYRNRHVLLCS